MSEFVCDACKLPPMVSADPEAPFKAGGPVPPGWFVRKIDRRTFTLCDCCGSMHHFKGGVSTYLQEELGLGPYAVLVLDDGPGSGLHRQRVIRDE